MFKFLDYQGFCKEKLIFACSIKAHVTQKNGISRVFSRISAFSRRTTMHLNGMLLIETEFCKIIVPL